MATEYGIWAENDGGFVATQLYSIPEAQDEVERILVAIEDQDERQETAQDLFIKAICPDHEEQRADACDECNSEDEDDAARADDDAAYIYGN